jgi:PAS domain S-box-containing protein
MKPNRRRARTGRRRSDAAAPHGRSPGAEEKLGRFDELVEFAPDAIFVQREGRILFANSAAVRIAHATTREQLIGLAVDDLLSPPWLKHSEVQLVAAGELVQEVAPVRDTLHRLDGSAVEVEVMSVAFLDHGQPAVHLVVRDVSERLAVELTAQHAERHMQQAQKMDAVGALAGGVAHEVNNMMLVIFGFADFLLEEAALPDGARRDVNEILKAAKRAAAVTRQLLSFSRRAFHHPRFIGAATLLSGLEPVIRQALGERLHLSLCVTPVSAVWADAGQLEQVLVNLALNARDAMPDGGTLSLHLSNRHLAESLSIDSGATIPAGNWVVLTVRDTGSGMGPAVRRRIFEPFFTTKAVGEGTGLGLAAAFGIMRQHHGYITVASTPGEGTTFELFFPAMPDAPPDEHPEAKSPPWRNEQWSGATILLVEDEPAVRLIATRTLEAAGFRILGADSGADALTQVDRHGAPALVLTDLMMPGMTGAELGHRLRERFPDLSILYMSGYSKEELRRQGADPMGPLLQKPFTPEVLVRRVRQQLADEHKALG